MSFQEEPDIEPMDTSASEGEAGETIWPWCPDCGSRHDPKRPCQVD